MTLSKRLVSGLARVRDAVTPKQPHFYGLLETAAEHVQLCTADAQMVCAATNENTLQEACQSFLAHRQAARAANKAVKHAVDTTFLPPINDRETHSLAEAFARVVKATKIALRAAELLDLPDVVEGRENMGGLIAEAGTKIVAGVRLLRSKDWNALAVLAHQIRDLEEQSDEIFLTGVKHLNQVDVQTPADLRELQNAQSLLYELENILDECASVAHVLQTIASGNR